MKTQYIGTYNEKQLNDPRLSELLTSLQSKTHMKDMQFINHRSINDDKQTEVWLSNEPSQYTVNAPKA